MMSTHQAHLLMIFEKMAYFQMMGGFDSEVSGIPYSAQGTFINDTIGPPNGLVTRLVVGAICLLDINRYAQYWEK